MSLQHQIAITLIPNVGNVIGRKLIEYCGNVESVFETKKQSVRKIRGIGEALATALINGRDAALKLAESEITFIEKYKIQPLFFFNDDFPQRLKYCTDAPLMLYFKGKNTLNATKIISIVGTRNATSYGKKCCSDIIDGFAGTDVTIVSGLAYGIDSCAHSEALKKKLSTIGVLAHGLDRIYPAENKNLAGKMIESGGLITEFMSNTNPDRENFPQRNRIIAGLADATLVIEAAKKGGALITADIANSYNRDVFAVPGKINDEYSAGCNHFIKTNKAHLIQSADDIKYIMGWETNKAKKKTVQHKLFINLSPEEETIIQFISKNEEISIDGICHHLGEPASKVASALLNLEFQGLIKCLPGKRYSMV